MNEEVIQDKLRLGRGRLQYGEETLLDCLSASQYFESMGLLSGSHTSNVLRFFIHYDVGWLNLRHFLEPCGNPRPRYRESVCL
jgi:hypothetical protein